MFSFVHLLFLLALLIAPLSMLTVFVLFCRFLWRRHVERIRRQQEVALRRERLDPWIRWFESHPWQANLAFLGFLCAVGEIAMLLKHAIDRAAR